MSYPEVKYVFEVFRLIYFLCLGLDGIHDQDVLECPFCMVGAITSQGPGVSMMSKR